MTKKLPASTNISQDKGIAFKINAKTSLIHPPTLYQQQPAGEEHVYSHIYVYLPRAHAQGVKQSVCPSVVVVVVVVVVGTKIVRSRVLGVCACYKHIQSIDIDEKLVCTGFELLKKAY